MKTITKALVGTVAAGAMAMASAAPAQAQYRDRDRGGIDAGDIIAGALIIGGIAAVTGAIGGRNRGYNDGRVYEGSGGSAPARWLCSATTASLRRARPAPGGRAVRHAAAIMPALPRRALRL